MKLGTRFILFPVSDGSQQNRFSFLPAFQLFYHTLFPMSLIVFPESDLIKNHYLYSGKPHIHFIIITRAFWNSRLNEKTGEGKKNENQSRMDIFQEVKFIWVAIILTKKTSFC